MLQSCTTYAARNTDTPHSQRPQSQTHGGLCVTQALGAFAYDDWLFLLLAKNYMSLNVITTRGQTLCCCPVLALLRVTVTSVHTAFVQSLMTTALSFHNPFTYVQWQE